MVQECQEFADSLPQSVDILRFDPALECESQPNEIKPEGLSFKCKWYPYNLVHPLCNNVDNADKFIKKPK